MEFILFVGLVWLAIYAVRKNWRTEETIEALQQKGEALEKRIEWVRTHPVASAAPAETKPEAKPAAAATIAFSRTARAARCTELPAVTVCRLAKPPSPSWMVEVSPQTTVMSSGRTPT